MKACMKNLFAMLGMLALTASVSAKIPAPVLSDEAKAKAAEAAAKTAWTGKVDGYQLCKAQNRVAAHAMKTAKAAGKETKPATDTPACADPGPFLATGAAPAAPAAAPVMAAAAAKSAKKP